MIKVLLSLDLIESEDQRDDFYEHLKEQNWLKTKDVDTVWTIKFPNANPDNEEHYKSIRDKIARVLIDAATALKLKKIYYVAQLGNHEVISREISKIDGTYKCTFRNLYPQ
ncbi:hypothetical protein PSCICJ_41770 [Pseudomonas cichorii]|uniref:hypothetical protein n=1 Tax=Pseudomonas cichorii TaxID=36746 RepID=UPI00191015FA|nr:hypothetical protein [Pseudomonas cichorii]GFM68059.1 hypothetical protein PSCICJ_41770 [Pseudomonas cichorii]